MNVFVINGGQIYAQAKGQFNQSIADRTVAFFKERAETEIRHTNINQPYSISKEIENFIWADIIVYHTPIWWFQLPNGLKKYFDEVLNTAKGKGIWTGDGRSSKNPSVNYGTGGLLSGKYVVTTTWNAPVTAFTLPNEFFNKVSVDDGILYGFHKMNAFIGLAYLGSFHFHDIVKNGNIETDLDLYTEYLNTIINK
ncbi:MAG: NADPH quinone reductase MdaB [Pedobacter sp.]|nr:MAG: NADPH quinone reductase MdaB [Pedobacter sp.]